MYKTKSGLSGYVRKCESHGQPCLQCCRADVSVDFTSETEKLLLSLVSPHAARRKPRMAGWISSTPTARTDSPQSPPYAGGSSATLAFRPG